MRGGSESKRCLKEVRHWGGDFSRVAFRDSRRASVRVVLPIGGIRERYGEESTTFLSANYLFKHDLNHIDSYEFLDDITF